MKKIILLLSIVFQKKSIVRYSPFFIAVFFLIGTITLSLKGLPDTTSCIIAICLMYLLHVATFFVTIVCCYTDIQGYVAVDHEELVEDQSSLAGIFSSISYAVSSGIIIWQLTGGVLLAVLILIVSAVYAMTFFGIRIKASAIGEGMTITGEVKNRLLQKRFNAGVSK